METDSCTAGTDPSLAHRYGYGVPQVSPLRPGTRSASPNHHATFQRHRARVGWCPFKPLRLPLFFLHFLAYQLGMPGLGINHSASWQAATGDGVGILLFCDDAVLDDFTIRRRQLATNFWRSRRDRRWRCCNWLLLRRTATQEQAKDKTTFLHSYCFRSVLPSCRLATLITVRGRAARKRRHSPDGLVDRTTQISDSTGFARGTLCLSCFVASA